MAARDPTVEEYAIRFVRKYLKVSARAPPRPFPRAPPRAPRTSPAAPRTSLPSFPSSSPRPTPLPAPRAPSSPQGDFARAARTNDDDDANRAAAADTLVDLLRKCSDDPVLLKVPLRVLRDEILRRYDEHRRRRERDRASSSSSSEDEPSLPRDVESLFALFDGVHRTCVTLASRLTAGPYETIDRALRLRLFLCVCGETWRDAPALRASALRRCHAFAREEDAHEASRKTTTMTTGWLGSIASRAVPAFVSHDAVDVSSWRRVIGQIFARCPARLMSPTVECLLESLRRKEGDSGDSGDSANVNGPIASRQLELDGNDNDSARTTATPPPATSPPDLLGDAQLCAGFDGFDVTTPIDDDRKNLTAGWETFETPPTTLTPPTPTLTTTLTTDGRSSRALPTRSSTGASTGEKGLVFDGSFGSDASLTSAFRPRADPFTRADHGTSHAPGATSEPPAASVSASSFGAFGSFLETSSGKEPSRSPSSAADGSGKLGALASVAARLPVRDSHDFDELVRDLERM